MGIRKGQVAPKTTPAEKALIVKGRLAGKSSRAIAKEIGKTHGTVNKILSTNKVVKETIEREAGRIIRKGLRASGDLIVSLVMDGSKVRADKDEKRLGFDAAKHITNIAGISGGAPGTVINTMIQVNQPNRAEELSNVQRFLASQWGNEKEEDIQDGEVEEKS